MIQKIVFILYSLLLLSRNSNASGPSSKGKEFVVAFLTGDGDRNLFLYATSEVDGQGNNFAKRSVIKNY